MAISTSRLSEATFARAAPLIGLCTVALTAAFVGIVTFVDGRAAGVVGRLPIYVLASAALFVTTLVVGDDSRIDGTVVLLRAAVAAVGGFVLITLGVEGLRYVLTDPDAVVASHLFVYLLSAAMVSSGLGYWTLHNWRDVRPHVRR